MTQRERSMATVLGSLLVCGLGVAAVYWFYSAVASSKKNADALDDQLAEAQFKINKVYKDGSTLERWRKMSLTGDTESARAAYREYLTHLLSQSKLNLEQFGSSNTDTKSTIIHPTKPGKAPIYNGLTFSIKFNGELPSVVAFLRDFQTKPFMHRVRNMQVERANPRGDSPKLNVTLTAEALMILDADKATKAKGFFDGRFVVLDALAALTNGPGGLGVARYEAGQKLAPLNLPNQARNYDDIGKRNFFTGPVTKVIKTDDIKIRDKPPTPPSDDVINMMRFAKFDQLSEVDDKMEGMLWDWASNARVRLSPRPGFNRFPLVQTDQANQFAKIIQGTVIKIEGSDLIYRITLQASDATYTTNKWWRYPLTQDVFSRVHNDEFKGLVSTGKATENDKGRLFLTSVGNWEKQTRKGSDSVTLLTGGKSFHLKKEFANGEVIFTDKDVVVVRIDGKGEPPGGATTPSVPMSRFYPEQKIIYRVNDKHFADMVTDKGLKITNPLKGPDIDRVYVMYTKYWDTLTNQRILRTEGGESTFKFYSDLIGGEVISRSDNSDGVVVFRLWEQYCHCKGDFDLNIKDRWHEGFLVLRLSNFVQDSLMTPLPENRLKDFVKKGTGLDK